jgi:hypothetical protein
MIRIRILTYHFLLLALGAVQNWTRLQDSLAPCDQALFSIVDLHSFTTSTGRTVAME